MVTAFTSGTKVRFKIGGQLAVIGKQIPAGKWDWRIPGYLGEGFYQVDTPEGRSLIVREDDIILAEFETHVEGR